MANFNLPDKAVQKWRNFHYKGKTYTFEHLCAKKLTFENPNIPEKYTLYITISHHVFTEGVKNKTYTNDELYPNNKDKRVFSIERYLLSKRIPDILSNLPNQFFYHGGHGKYCSCKIENSKGVEVTYQIVYRIWRQERKLRFHIESAYPLENNGRKKKVKFWTICHNLINGKKPPKPP
tara:strand:+ start:1099 stop:1632 length:534 start_codon:yes stop_codon:yes gene_type:complete